MLRGTVERIERRLAALGLSAQGASIQAGLGKDAIRDMKRGVSGQKASMKGTRFATLQKLAPVLETSALWLLNGEGSEDGTASRGGGVLDVPIVSWVAAGKPAQALDQWGDWPTISVCDLPRGEWIALRVIGDSMDRIAPDGSTVLVNIKDREAMHHGFYIAAIAGQTTFKRYIGGTQPMLAPYSTNLDHMPIPVTEQTRIIGRVRRTIADW